jgi:alginate O-acetyltransferase complex protein AlgI
MSFISLEFLLLVALTFFLYYSRPLRALQVITLIVASLVFYAYDQWKLLPLLVLTVAITYYSMLGAIKGNRTLATLGVASNIFILAFFKYKFLVVSNPANLNTGTEILDFLIRLPLPIGISFFVFHNISLIVDYFKYGQKSKTPTINQILLYIFFFPQLVSGPITRAKSFLPQIKPKFIKDVPWIQVGRLLITGLFFKLFCANNLAQITAQMAPELASALGGGDKLFLLFVYSFQIYSDFFGYSTIALGLALLFGYRLPVNFKQPYTSASFSDFWNRWHISLSMWLRQYLYIPLGGNRISHARTYVNLLIVMILGGLWHGAALSYAAWGLAHGTLLAIERYFGQVIDTYAPGFRFGLFSKFSYSILVFVCVSLCWLLFRFQEFSQASAYLISILDDPINFKMLSPWYGFAFLYMLPVIIQHIDGGCISIAPRNKALKGIFFGILLWLAFAERGADTQFIYFRF